MRQPCKTTLCPTVTRSPTTVEKPLESTWMTVLSWMLVSLPMWML